MLLSNEEGQGWELWGNLGFCNILHLLGYDWWNTVRIGAGGCSFTLQIWIIFSPLRVWNMIVQAGLRALEISSNCCKTNLFSVVFYPICTELWMPIGLKQMRWNAPNPEQWEIHFVETTSLFISLSNKLFTTLEGGVSTYGVNDCDLCSFSSKWTMAMFCHLVGRYHYAA